MLRRRRVILRLLIGCFFIYMLYLMTHFTLTNSNPADVYRNRNAKNHTRWIVVTTINPPTPQMKVLSQIPGWQLLVVADLKTPTDWTLPGAIFLSVEKQKSLNFHIHQHLPYNTYTRKAIGYLYAMKNGAEFIYDTDDDNSPLDDLTRFYFTSQSHMLIPVTSNITFNPFPHFGQSSMWPRGFPLEHIGNAQPRLYEGLYRGLPAIQQGLVNGDPDVDAIFRMTRKPKDMTLNLTFDDVAPPVVLPDGVFAPCNSQNTLFVKNAFWSLILPTTVSDRATDIFRGYWAQTLLSLTGAKLAFLPPTTFQQRNIHSYIADSIEEAILYQKSGKLVKYLSKWNCDKDFLYDCMIELTANLVSTQFLGVKDNELLTAWIKDLKDIGYTPPEVQKTKISKHSKDSMIFFPHEKPTSVAYSNKFEILPELTNKLLLFNTISSTCGYKGSLQWGAKVKVLEEIHDFLLVVTIEQDVNVIPLIHSLYSANIAHIVYCGYRMNDLKKVYQWKVSYVILDEDVSPMKCLFKVIEMNYSVKGYMHVTSTALIQPNAFKFVKQNLKMFIYSDNREVSNIERCVRNELACDAYQNRTVESTYARLVSKELASKCLQGVHIDRIYDQNVFFYLPSSFVTGFKTIFNSFSENPVGKLNFLIFTIFNCLSPIPERFYLSDSINFDSNMKNVHFLSPFTFNKMDENQHYKEIYCRYM